MRKKNLLTMRILYKVMKILRKMAKNLKINK